MTINRKRLIALAEWAGAQDARRRLGLPSEWRQEDWLTKLSCGTACCIAGKVALEDGGKPYIEDCPWEEMDEDDGAHQVTFGDSEPTSVREHAQVALGLDWAQGSRLFDASNDLDDVLLIIKELLALETDFRAGLEGYLDQAAEHPSIYGDRVAKVNTLREMADE